MCFYIVLFYYLLKNFWSGKLFVKDIGLVCLYGKEVEYLMFLDYYKYVIYLKLRDVYLQLFDLLQVGLN